MSAERHDTVGETHEPCAEGRVGAPDTVVADRQREDLPRRFPSTLMSTLMSTAEACACLAAFVSASHTT